LDIFFLLLCILFTLLILDQNEDVMDIAEEQDVAVDGVNVHQQDINTPANDVQDGAGAMNGIYLLICYL